MGGYEQIQQIPTMGMMLDPTLAQTYIAGLRELYNLAKEDWDNFIKTNSDFYSPSDVDNQNYYNMTRGEASKLLNTYGPDLLRSPEGRMAIAKMISNVDYGALANMRASADNMKKFIESRDALIAQGKYNEAWDKQYSDMVDPTSWDSSKGVWTRMSPSAVQTLHDLTKSEYEKLQPTVFQGITPGSKGQFVRFVVDETLKNNAYNSAAALLESVPGVAMYKQEVLNRLQQDPTYLAMTDEQKAQAFNTAWRNRIENEQAMYLQPKDEVNQAYITRLSHAGSGSGSTTTQPTGSFAYGLAALFGFMANNGLAQNKDEKYEDYAKRLLSTLTTTKGVPKIKKGEKLFDWAAKHGKNRPNIENLKPVQIPIVETNRITQTPLLTEQGTGRLLIKPNQCSGRIYNAYGNKYTQELKNGDNTEYYATENIYFVELPTERGKLTGVLQFTSKSGANIYLPCGMNTLNVNTTGAYGGPVLDPTNISNITGEFMFNKAMGLDKPTTGFGTVTPLYVQGQDTE